MHWGKWGFHQVKGGKAEQWMGLERAGCVQGKYEWSWHLRKVENEHVLGQLFASQIFLMFWAYVMLKQLYNMRIPLVLASLKVNSWRKTWMQIIHGGGDSRKQEGGSPDREAGSKEKTCQGWFMGVTTGALVPGTSWKAYRRSPIIFYLKEWIQIRSEGPLRHLL